jgi:23S rRNA U2552 (ribose-2'-O)-methylase RlmE/FtsJ
MVFFDPRSIGFESKQGRFTANVSVLFVQLDEKNQILDSAQRSFPLDFSPGQYAQFMKQQVEFEQSIALSARASQLRVVVWDSTSGKVGAVAIPLGKYLATAASGTGSTH